ncbi:hypothetical protein H6768_00145 [Candidatus Peribacteria bacterium]|nr:hypothetical protein [Candidatus Peribacteria bacterium]
MNTVMSAQILIILIKLSFLKTVIVVEIVVSVTTAKIVPTVCFVLI